jgi:triosephosphate isomerase
MRQKIVAGNWKMNMTLGSGSELVNGILDMYRDLQGKEKVVTILCPPYLFVPQCASATATHQNLFTGAQNCHHLEKGAYTGEIAAAMLADAGATYVILGHSERRSYFGETDEMINAKIKAAIAAGLNPILCCGEVLAERESGLHQPTVEKQILGAFKDLSPADAAKTIIAYEPVWAIGTGLTASPDQAEEMHEFIRGVVAGIYGNALAREIRILYGGSCNAANATELFSRENVDGGLIGGASLKAADFISIVKSAIETSNHE